MRDNHALYCTENSDLSDQISSIEQFINEVAEKKLPVGASQMKKPEALALGAVCARVRTAFIDA